MAELSRAMPLTGDADFDARIMQFSDEQDPVRLEELRQGIWDRFGTEGAVFISDMAGFSSTSRKLGVCHFLKMICRARQILATVVADCGGSLLKCDADNSYAYFKNTDDAIRASLAANAAVFAANEHLPAGEQIFLSVGIDYGRLLLIGDNEFFGDPVNTASKLGEDLAVRSEVLVTQRALDQSTFEVPNHAERMTARISGIEIRYVRLPMTEARSHAD